MTRRPPPPGRPRRRTRGRLNLVALAGWLFADLLLVLTVVMLADRADPLAAEPEPTKSGGPSSASPSPTSSPSASPSPTGPRSVESKWVTFEVRGTGEKDLVRQIRKDTERWSGRKAAMVLTFGGTQSGDAYARKVNRLLYKARPGMFSAKATASDDFHDLSSPPNSARLRVYFYTAPR